MRILFRSGEMVEIRVELFSPAERLAHLPDDTARRSYMYRATGLLIRDARVGDEATIRTMTGRELEGTLQGGHLGFKHGFGQPPPALLAVRQQISSMWYGP
jgi:hypothetical protein